MSMYQGRLAPPPHELLTMSGRRSGRGLAPLRSVGARIHCAEASRAVSEQLFVSQPLAAIHCAPGATPIWLPAPSSPTMVPMVWVPWPLLSHGAADGPQTCGRVEPVVVVVEGAVAEVAAVLADQRRVVELDAGVDVGDDDALAADAELGPDVVGVDVGDAPLDGVDRELGGPRDLVPACRT